MKFSCWIDFLATSMRLTVGGDQDPYYLPDHNVLYSFTFGRVVLSIECPS